MIRYLTTVLEHINVPADWIGIRAMQGSSTTRSMRDGHPQRNEYALNRGAMIEVLAGGQFGYSATNQLTPESLLAAAQQAYDQAVAASRWAVHRFTAAVRPTVVGSYISPLDQPFDSISSAEVNDLLHQLCEHLKVSANVVRTSAIARTHEIETWLVSSNGSQVHQKFSLIESHLGAIAHNAGVTQARTNNGPMAHSYQGGWEKFKTADLWERATRIGEQAVELLDAPDCPSDITTLVLAPDQMMLQLHESVGHPLELDRILGDERNYAGGSFVQPQDFGHLVYGSPLMNVTFDATRSGELASYDYDDTATPAKREYLIHEGVLQRGLGSLESQNRLNVLVSPAPEPVAGTVRLSIGWLTST